MRKVPFAFVLVLAITAMAYATDQTATCPQDGDKAGFTGNKKIDLEHPLDRSKDVCEYKHSHPGTDANGQPRQETHTFWKNCGD